MSQPQKAPSLARLQTLSQRAGSQSKSGAKSAKQPALPPRPAKPDPAETPEAVRGLDYLSTPVWLWDPQESRIVWGNQAAIGFWAADDLKGFRKGAANVAEGTAEALAAFAKAESPEENTPALWTAVRDGEDVTVPCHLTLIQSGPSTPAVLVELNVVATISNVTSAISADLAESGDSEPSVEVVQVQRDLLDSMAKGSGLDEILKRFSLVMKLRNANKRFTCLAQSIPGVVYQRRVSPDGDIRYTYISEGVRDLFGVSAEDVLTDPNALFECHGPEYRETFRERLIQASKDLTMWDVEAQIITPDGEEKWAHAIARPHRQPDGAVLWDGVILDATRNKKAEIELRTAKEAAEAASQARGELAGKLRSADERFTSLSQSIPGVVYQRRVSPDGDIRYTYISEGAKDLFGVSAEEILADPKALFACHGPEYRETFRERLLQASKDMTMWDVEAQIITRDGEEKWTHAIARPHKEPDGSVLWNGVILDATRIKKAEFELRTAKEAAEAASQAEHELVERLRSATERVSALAASIPGVVYQRRVSPDGDIRYTYISEGAKDLFGVSAEEILADPKALFACHGPEYRETFRERLLQASKDMTMWDVEAQIITRDGEEKWTHAIARPHKEPDGSVLWDGVILDATRLKRAEFAAADAAANTRKIIVESISQGFILFDPDDRLVICNGKYFDLYPELESVAVPGASYEAIARAELGLPDGAENGKALDPRLRERMEKHQKPDHVDQRQWPDGRWILISEHRSSDGSTVVLFTDVSDLKRREEKLEHVNRQLDIALENMAEGLCVFDSKHRIVLSNRRYAQIFGLPEALAGEGTRVDDHMDKSFGIYRYDKAAIEALVQERLSHIETRKRSTYFLNLPDGRTIEAKHRPLADGGAVETFSEW